MKSYKQRGKSGMVSREIYHQRFRLVEAGLASWFLPYKTLKNALRALN